MRAFYCLPSVILACGGDDPLIIDAPSSTEDASPFCLIAGDYGDVGTKTGTTSLGPTTSTIVLDAGPPRDSFFVKLTAGNGVFAGGLDTGTFTISGAELSSTTCGLCLNLLADIGTTGPSKFYFATSGTVTLTSHTPPAGTLSAIEITEVTSGGVVIQGGCRGSIGAMTFSTN